MFVFLIKRAINTCITPSKHEILILTLYDILILDDVDLKCTHRKLRVVLGSVGDLAHIDLLTLFPFDAVTMRDKTRHDKLSSIFTLT